MSECSKKSSQEESLHQTAVGWHLDLGDSGLQNGGKCISVVDKPLPPQVMVSLLQQPKLRRMGKGPRRYQRRRNVAGNTTCTKETLGLGIVTQRQDRLSLHRIVLYK